MIQVQVKRKRKKRISVSMGVNPIDYEKLAEAIANAQGKTEKKQQTSSFRAMVMHLFNIFVYLSIAFTFGLFARAFWLCSADVVVRIVCCGFCILLAIIMLLAIIESFRDKENDVLDYFNSNVGTVALIIALITLLREVL